MLYRITGFFLLLMFLALTACVSVISKNQYISNTSSTGSELQSCEMAAVINEPAENIQGLNPSNIAFLNWNIYKGNGDNWQNDLSAFAKNHNVMTLQEVMLSDEMTALLQTYGFNWIMNTAFYLNGAAAGVMNVASTIAVHSCGFKVDEPLIGIPKSTLVSYYLINGSNKRLLVANIHGINFTLGVSSYSDQMDKLYEAIKRHNGPMIVAGDFNSWSDDRMLIVNQLVERLGLSKLEYSVNNKTHVFGNAIDHVFYRQLEPLKHQVQQVYSSDHNPISVNFRVRSEDF
jgi:endonuclease/exonuclease/phosphatase (EEP) superfamily protein YafD